LYLISAAGQKSMTMLHGTKFSLMETVVKTFQFISFSF